MAVMPFGLGALEYSAILGVMRQFTYVEKLKNEIFIPDIRFDTFDGL
jgi:hypothetical protein